MSRLPDSVNNCDISALSLVPYKGNAQFLMTLNFFFYKLYTENFSLQSIY